MFFPDLILGLWRKFPTCACRYCGFDMRIAHPTLFCCLLLAAGCQESGPSDHGTQDQADLTAVRWLDFGESPPHPLAIDSSGRKVVVKTKCETIVYDLASGQKLHTWPQVAWACQFCPNDKYIVFVAPQEARS